MSLNAAFVIFWTFFFLYLFVISLWFHFSTSRSNQIKQGKTNDAFFRYFFIIAFLRPSNKDPLSSYYFEYLYRINDTLHVKNANYIDISRIFLYDWLQTHIFHTNDASNAKNAKDKICTGLHLWYFLLKQFFNISHSFRNEMLLGYIISSLQTFKAFFEPITHTM